MARLIFSGVNLHVFDFEPPSIAGASRYFAVRWDEVLAVSLRWAFFYLSAVLPAGWRAK